MLWYANKTKSSHAYEIMIKKEFGKHIYTYSLSPKINPPYDNLQNTTWVICCTFSC